MCLVYKHIFFKLFPLGNCIDTLKLNRYHKSKFSKDMKRREYKFYRDKMSNKFVNPYHFMIFMLMNRQIYYYKKVMLQKIFYIESLSNKLAQSSNLIEEKFKIE